MGAFLSWTTDAGQSGALFFDAVTEEQKDFTSTATEHPVEDGANVADHVRRELDKIALEVFVSNAPVYDWNGRGGVVKSTPIKLAKFKPPFAPTPGAVFSAIGGAISDLLSGNQEYSANVLQFSSGFDAIADTEEQLAKLKDDVQLVNVVTSTRSHENMFLTHWTVIRNPPTGDGAVFRLEFKEIRKVTVSIVDAPKPSELRGATMKPKGAKNPKDAKAPAQKKSLMKAGIELITKRLAGDGGD